MARILLVEDNADLAEGLRYNLELEGYDVLVADNGETGLDRALSGGPDLIILDAMLPRMDGFQVLRRLRSEEIDTPVLMLTALGEEEDKVRGFRLDVDQYVTKPFHLLELLERVKSLLRRKDAHDRSGSPSSPIEFGDVHVDPAKRTVHVDGAEVSLTPRAFDLMIALIEKEGAVASRQELLRDVWGHRGLVMTRTVDSHIKELRKKLERNPSEPEHFITVWKVGYRFQA
jgi:two-component system alkaline phosphatase synthesis response regulator PhoP